MRGEGDEVREGGRKVGEGEGMGRRASKKGRASASDVPAFRALTSVEGDEEEEERNEDGILDDQLETQVDKMTTSARTGDVIHEQE